jgi:hypothetical protein
MKRSLRWFTVAAVLVGPPALAHEQGGRAIGVVRSVTPERIVVKASDGHEVPCVVTSKTRFVRDASPVKLEDVEVGQRVVVHGKRSGDRIEAAEVKLGSKPKP